MSSSRMNGNPYAGERMDRTLSVVLGILVVSALVFFGAVSLWVYTGISYRATLSSTYEYRVSIATDETLGNVTLYLPVPARGPGSSAVLERIGSGDIKGVPAGWNISLIGTEKFTMLDLTAGEIGPSPPGSPYLLSLDTRVSRPINTKNAGSDDLVLRSVTQVIPAACEGRDPKASPEMRCWLYQGPAYADYTSDGNERISVLVSLAGRNAWDVFGPSSNEYRDRLQFSFAGERKGWRTGDGSLVTGIGDYGIEFWLPEERTPGPAPGWPRDLAWWPLAIRGGAA
jgi:hypothetical protein